MHLQKSQCFLAPIIVIIIIIIILIIITNRSSSSSNCSTSSTYKTYPCADMKYGQCI